MPVVVYMCLCMDIKHFTELWTVGCLPTLIAGIVNDVTGSTACNPFLCSIMEIGSR